MTSILCYGVLAAAASSPLMASAQHIAFANSSVAATIDTSGGSLLLGNAEDRRTHATIPQGEAFILVLSDGREIKASAMKLVSSLHPASLVAEPHASRAAAHLAGRELCGDLTDSASSATVHWCILSRGDSNYLRQEITIHAGDKPLPLADVQMLRFTDSAARVIGSVAGSPIVSGSFFRGFEHPLAYAAVSNSEATSGLKRTLPLQSGQSITYSSVMGVARSGQMRRDFLSYVELERAHPYRTFLHYNTWYDLATGPRFDQAGILDRMNAFGTELVRKRGVTMDSFLMDDGWDDTSSLWQFHSGFPQGFAPLRATAKSYGFGIGVWLSPWGGYSTEKKERIAYGRSQGYEIVKNGYALSGPRYYAKFEEASLNFIRKYGVNQFKVDGTGNANQVFPGSAFDSDFSAAIHLIERLRQQDPSIFINLSTGTRPSPFWLRYTDAVWRDGEDHDFAGEGSWRQKWITYRDGQTYRNIVQAGPLFPLNSLMLHGLIYGRGAKHLTDDPQHDFADEVHTYFGSGTQLQEMYITPSLLTSSDWDSLAEAARWSRVHAATLKDTHWIGGDPLSGEAYGWASWSSSGAILTLRNPSPQPRTITIDAAKVFELLSAAPRTYRMRSPWKADSATPVIVLRAGQPHLFELKPFQVITLQSAAR